MKILKKVIFDEVLENFDVSHPVTESPNFRGNKWAKQILEQADKDFSDSWALLELETKDILNIVLPYHPSEDGTTELVNKVGMRVEETVEKIKGLPNYASGNPICWNKITYWKMNAFIPIFLSTIPVSATRQKLVDPSMGTLFHLDGLHRLIGWGLDGRYESSHYNSGTKLTAYVAGVKIENGDKSNLTCRRVNIKRE